jgi:TolB-like protein/DNA-binding winged helix-turn-helix (wHTH) protein/thioredoxin-like negative regulator of GroEL
MESPARARRFRFGLFEADLNTSELRKSGVKIKLQEHPFQILALLLKHRGELVTREELRKELWPADTFVDFDVGLNVAIKKLRAAIGDSAENSRFVETIPRHGYRFISRVEELAPVAEESSTSRKTRRQIAIWAGTLAVAGALILILGLNTGRLRSRIWGKPKASVIRSIAVLPLENFSGDSAQNYFTDGMTDALTTNLAEIADLTVISRAAAMQYKGKRELPGEIARELHVDALVEGSVVRSGNRVRIGAQLVDPATNRNIWSKSYERDLGDIINLQGEVARAIATEIEGKLQPRERALQSRTVTVKPEAYDYYLRGHLYSYRESSTDNEVAIGMLERAIALDSDFAPAYAQLADAYRVRFTQFAPQEKQWEEKAFRAADKALSLDPNLAEAYVARGFLLWTPSKGFQHKEAIQEYRHALSLNPNLDEAHHYLGNIYIHIGLLEQGLAELQRAVAINPSNTPARARIGVALLYQGKCEQALSIFQSNLWEANQSLRGYQIAWSLFCLGRTEDAFAAVDEYVKKHPADEGGLLSSMQALLFAATRQERLAELQIRQAQKGKDFIHFHHAEYNIASAYALMHRNELAIRWLQMAAAEGFPCYPVFARDPNLTNLRNDPRFAQFIADQKKQWEYYKTAL